MAHAQGSKDWARRLVEEYESGKARRPVNVYRTAYQALGREFPEGEPPQPKRAASVPAPRSAPLEHPWWDDDREEGNEHE